jgi:hypothetical protein
LNSVNIRTVMAFIRCGRLTRIMTTLPSSGSRVSVSSSGGSKPASRGSSLPPFPVPVIAVTCR